MRFIDEAKITIESGHGGPGAVSFRREKYVPFGGPDGGDGGKGGDIIFVCSERLTTLEDFRMKRKYAAAPGCPGQSPQKPGRDAEDIVIIVPLGTVIYDAETSEQLYDFTEHDERWVACRGGRGGKGNMFFASSTHQAPKFAQPGEEGSKFALRLELKLLADVAIMGFPNAGKSTLISVISAARPKIADYPFTTLTPNLGVVRLSEEKSIVVADIPGLIERAHEGHGLGIRFLKHLERTRALIHLINGEEIYRFVHFADTPPTEREIGDLVIKQYQTIRDELRAYDPKLTYKPEIVAINKVDLLDEKTLQIARKALRQSLQTLRGSAPEGEEPLGISSATRTGIDDLRKTLLLLLSQSESPKADEAIRLPDDEALKA